MHGRRRRDVSRLCRRGRGAAFHLGRRKIVDDETKKILYVQTHGVDMPERSATPFYLAAAGAAMDADVGIYFTMNGPTLLQKGVPETLIVPKKGGGGKELMDFIRQALERGGGVGV